MPHPTAFSFPILFFLGGGDRVRPEVTYFLSYLFGEGLVERPNGTFY